MKYRLVPRLPTSTSSSRDGTSSNESSSLSTSILTESEPKCLPWRSQRASWKRSWVRRTSFTDRIGRSALRLEIGKSDRDIWLWPVAVPAPMGHTKNPERVAIEDHKTSYQLNPSVGSTLGGGFHCTMLDSIERIFFEGWGLEAEEIESTHSLCPSLLWIGDRRPFCVSRKW